MKPTNMWKGMNEMYCYYMVARPAGPGAQPKDGLVNIVDLDPSVNNPIIKRPAYALLEYNRALTVEEERSYEILPAVYSHDVLYRGYVLEWNEWEQSWRVYEQGKPYQTVAYVDTVEEAKAGIDEYLGESERS